MNISQVKEKAKIIKERVGLDTYPVGVKLIFSTDPTNFENAEKLLGHRYCQALMKARHGEHVLLDKEGISCPAAARCIWIQATSRRSKER